MSLFRSLRSRLRISLCLLGAPSALALLSGCPAPRSPLASPLATRAYLVDVRENAGAPEVRLIALELSGEGSDDYLAETVSIPSAAAALDEPAGTEAPRRDVYRVGLRDSELRIQPVVDQDVVLVLARPREELLADFKILADLRDRTGGATATAKPEGGYGPLPRSAAAEAIEELVSTKNLEWAAAKAEAERAQAGNGGLAAETRRNLTRIENEMHANREVLDQLMKQFEQAPDDVAGTRKLRHAIIERQLKLDDLAREQEEQQALLADAAPAPAAAWTSEELDALRARVDAALEVKP